MPPIPKDPKVRQRTNRSSSRAKLLTLPDQGVEAPPGLSEIRTDGRVWQKETLAWWQRVWDSPMAGEILKGDLDQLFVLAYLMDDFWREPGVKLAGEIRQQRQAFGLTPLDRRRLEWEIERIEGPKRSPAQMKRSRSADPRSALSIVP